MDVDITLNDTIGEEEVLKLYRANAWSSAEKPAQLLAALRGSHALVTARVSGELVGLGTAISDGHLVVYFPHMLVLPRLHGHGIGRKMMQTFLKKYGSFHQLMLTADGRAVEFYKQLGFERAGHTESMWIYAGTEH
ncbi:GNAT family N-acetyltransferase [Polaromonas sp. UC242_47]|uniref:GNAT family N-acetyltransferase n=1 Tax=Polaromonas sp. UC242_47 TaxID=3374626 RepID=UPI0037B85275